MRLKTELEKALDAPVALKMAGPGTLNVYVDGQQIYSYQRTKRLPDVQELVNIIRAREDNSSG